MFYYLTGEAFLFLGQGGKLAGQWVIQMGCRFSSRLGLGLGLKWGWNLVGGSLGGQARFFFEEKIDGLLFMVWDLGRNRTVCASQALSTARFMPLAFDEEMDSRIRCDDGIWVVNNNTIDIISCRRANTSTGRIFYNYYNP